ncbi:MAG: hypothetical protein HC802_21755, partial [Caldilineaceae bacterium]|nr:hypothetical protein [Caldilineaceae bacterium]
MRPEKAAGRGKSSAARRQAPQKLALGAWHALPATAHVQGTSPRFASLDGPATLSDCGAPTGYGWYRVKFHAKGKATVMLPQAGDRLHLYLDGRLERIVGSGPGAKHGPFAIKFNKTEKDLHTLVALADNMGRAAGGNDIERHKGLFGHLFTVKAIRSKPKIATAKPVSGFALRGFIEGRAADQLGETRQAVWTFAHPRKTPVIIEVVPSTDRKSSLPSGTFVLNDKPIAYFAGVSGFGEDRIVIEPGDAMGLKRGKNVLRFAPDHVGDNAADLAKRTTLFEATS